MTLKVRGMEAARKVQAVMRDCCSGLVEIGRASEVEATYWIHCPDLDALGEQKVLEALPEGSLIRVESATYRAPDEVDLVLPAAVRERWWQVSDGVAVCQEVRVFDMPPPVPWAVIDQTHRRK